MNPFGHWVPSLLHFKAEHLAVFLLGGKILKKVIPVQFHTIVTFECVGVLEYVSSMGSVSFLHSHRETRQKSPDGFSHVISTVSYLAFYCVFLHELVQDEAVQCWETCSWMGVCKWLCSCAVLNKVLAFWKEKKLHGSQLLSK